MAWSLVLNRFGILQENNWLSRHPNQSTGFRYKESLLPNSSKFVNYLTEDPVPQSVEFRAFLDVLHFMRQFSV
jgi:hypothetical protein